MREAAAASGSPFLQPIRTKENAAASVRAVTVASVLAVDSAPNPTKMERQAPSSRRGGRAASANGTYSCAMVAASLFDEMEVTSRMWSRTSHSTPPERRPIPADAAIAERTAVARACMSLAPRAWPTRAIETTTTKLAIVTEKLVTAQTAANAATAAVAAAAEPPA
eukprot:scaffold189951_cov28-Tisochrysis_lutea.AAC.1